MGHSVLLQTSLQMHQITTQAYSSTEVFADRVRSGNLEEPPPWRGWHLNLGNLGSQSDPTQTLFQRLCLTCLTLIISHPLKRFDEMTLKWHWMTSILLVKRGLKKIWISLYWAKSILTPAKRPWSHGSQRSAVHQDECVSPRTDIYLNFRQISIISIILSYFFKFGLFHWCCDQRSSWASRTLAATKWLLAIPSTWSSQNLLETQRPPQLFPCQYKKRQEMMRKFTW